MKTLGNIIWLLLGGFAIALEYIMVFCLWLLDFSNSYCFWNTTLYNYYRYSMGTTTF